MKSKLLLHQKRVLKSSTVVELKIWQVAKTKAYPDGVRYALIVIKPESNKKVLMDNHSPKGHHYHLDENEFDYAFKDLDQLINDFKNLVKIHMGVRPVSYTHLTLPTTPYV